MLLKKQLGQCIFFISFLVIFLFKKIMPKAEFLFWLCLHKKTHVKNIQECTSQTYTKRFLSHKYIIQLTNNISGSSRTHVSQSRHTTSEQSGRFNSMNQHFWLQNIKIYHKINNKCHFAKYFSLHKAIYQPTSTNF